MGLKLIPTESGYSYDMEGKSVLDIGGGPVSMLLKCVNLSYSKVIDPALYPEWVESRYRAARIDYDRSMAERMDEQGFDEAWIYNVLQHTEEPQIIIKKAKRSASVLRVFEWVDTVKNVGHPHAFTKESLDQMFGVNGLVTELNGQNECHGHAWTAYIVNLQRRSK